MSMRAALQEATERGMADGAEAARVASLRQQAPLGAFDEERVRYILVDMQVGGVVAFYRRKAASDPNSAEAVRRWDAGVRVRNPHRYDRVILPGRGWTIVRRGTTTPLDGMEVQLVEP